MNLENIKKNKPAIFVSTLALLIAGVVIFAQTDKNPSNDLTAIFQEKVTLPVGAQVNAILNSSVSSASSNIGDIVVATVSDPVVVGNDLIFPSGSKVFGKVSYLERAINEGAVKGGAVALAFDKVELPNGYQYEINGSVPLQRAENTVSYGSTVLESTGKQKFASGAKSTVLGAATGAAFGTAVGAIAGGRRGVGRGAWGGAAVGGGAGAAKGVYDAVTDKGRTVTTKIEIGQEKILASGENISVTLDKSIQLVPQPLG